MALGYLIVFHMICRCPATEDRGCAKLHTRCWSSSVSKDQILDARKVVTLIDFVVDSLRSEISLLVLVQPTISNKS